MSIVYSLSEWIADHLRGGQLQVEEQPLELGQAIYGADQVLHLALGLRTGTDTRKLMLPEGFHF